jgi:hypothetical protein
MPKKDVVRRMRRRMVGDGLKLGWGKRGRQSYGNDGQRRGSRVKGLTAGTLKRGCSSCRERCPSCLEYDYDASHNV